MTNAEMTANRFAAWHKARVLVRTIEAHIAGGGSVVIGSSMASRKFNAKSGATFRATRSGAYMSRDGKAWDALMIGGYNRQGIALR